VYQIVRVETGGGPETDLYAGDDGVFTIADGTVEGASSVAPAAERCTAVVGLSVTESDEPLARPKVRFERLVRGLRIPVLQGEADNEGRIACEVTAGRYVVTCERGTYRHSAVTKEIEVGSDDMDIQVDFPPLPVLWGKVTDETGEPLRSGHVGVLVAPGHIFGIETGEDGAYGVGFTGGRCFVGPKSDGFTDYREVVVAPEGYTQVDLTIKPRSRFALEVTFAAGVVQSTDVSLCLIQKGRIWYSASAPVGEDGSVSVMALPGAYDACLMRREGHDVRYAFVGPVELRDPDATTTVPVRRELKWVDNLELQKTLAARAAKADEGT
jgi:hypothetical protein